MVSTYRMQYLKTVIHAVMQQSQQKIIKNLQFQNLNLKNQNQYFLKIIQTNQISASTNYEQQFIQQPNYYSTNQSFYSTILQNDQQKMKYNQHRKSHLPFKQKNSLFTKQNNHHGKSQQNSKKGKQIDHTYQRNGRQNINEKNNTNNRQISDFYDSQSDSRQILKALQNKQPNQFIVNLKQNQYKNSIHCLSSIQPISTISSNSSSQRNNYNPQSPYANNICGLSLRQQLQLLKSGRQQTIRMEQIKRNKQSGQKESINDRNYRKKRYLQNDYKNQCQNRQKQYQNNQNQSRFQFKYLKI